MAGDLDRVRRWIRIGAFSAFAAVLLGAFGTHWLRDRVEPERLSAHEAAARYQMYHSLAILLASALAPRLRPRAVDRVGPLFLAGVLLFSGSLYLIAWTGARWLGAITPLGGACFWAGWILLAWSAVGTDAAR